MGLTEGEKKFFFALIFWSIDNYKYYIQRQKNIYLNILLSDTASNGLNNKIDLFKV